jgi:hypothetical protein
MAQKGVGFMRDMCFGSCRNCLCYLRERLLGGGGRVADYLPQIEPAQNGTDARFDLMYIYPAEGF